MKIYVLSVGINDYGGQIAVPNLTSAVNDACSVYGVLRKSYNADGRLLSSDKPPVSAGSCEPQGHGTRGEILRAINEARRYLEPEDLFVFFFSGHGVGEAPGYILPHSAEYGRPGTYLMYQTLFGTLATLPCKHIMCFLGSCYAGAAAAVPADMPGMILQQKRAILYAATDERTATPDRWPANPNGCSLFAQALIDYLEHETPVGASFSPEALAAYLDQNARSWVRLNDGRQVEVHPVFVCSLPAVGLGNFRLEIRRPGFGLEVIPVHRCATGDTLRIPVRLNGAKSERIEWTAQSRLTGFEPARMDIRDGVLELVFQYPGDFDIEIAATNIETKEKACRTVAVHVHPGESPPPAIDEQPLAFWQYGVHDSNDLRITGGTTPFQVVIDGLPEGLEYELSDPWMIRIHGTVPSLGGGGTPLSGDNGPVVRMIDIHVKDSSGRHCHERRRFVVYSPQDYCHVKTGTYCIGCSEDAATTRAICDVLRPDMERIAKANGMNVKKVKDALNDAARGIANEDLRAIASSAPYACVDVQSYLIKKYPVTVHDWKRFLDATNAPHIPESRWPPETSEDLKKPVTGITYKGLCAYLKWKGTRLPTGREWQVAADGGKGFLFPWGNVFDHAKCNMRGGPRPVGLTPVDAFDHAYVSKTGTRDMVGNVYEWVDRRVYWRKRRAFAQVFRGGSFQHTPHCGIVSRDSNVTSVLYGVDANAAQTGQTAFDWLGFRDVIDLDPTPKEGQGTVVIPASDIKSDNGDEHRHVPQFRMAKYAVSNLEYWEFVRATGHRRPKGWEPRGDALPFPHSERHLPVVNVSYLDAHEFCLWKSRVKGGVYRLPTPEQWLAALQGGEEHRFPWQRPKTEVAESVSGPRFGANTKDWPGSSRLLSGASWKDEFNLQLCNEITSGWGKPVPVFDLPEGRSKEGVYNLVGNVYEWVGPLEVRGGSWLTDCQDLAENWYRVKVKNDGSALDFRDGDVGFRYVVLEVPTDSDR